MPSIRHSRSTCTQSGPGAEPEGRSRVRRFLRDVRGGATSIATVFVAVMVVAAAALIVDHNWLVDKRDVMKSASEAAAAAATIEMKRPGVLEMDPDDLQERLDRVAKNYVLLNLSYLPEERFKEADDTLEITVTPNLQARAVAIVAKADLGGTLFSRHLPVLGEYEGPEKIKTAAKFEGITAPVEVVLAIDISASMRMTLDGRADWRQDSRMDIVRRAATALVDIVSPSTENKVAVGVVPWQSQVRLDRAMRQDWVSKDWAKYPDSRHYGAIYACKPFGNCTVPSENQDLPSNPGVAWLGCLDEQRIDDNGLADLPNEADLLSLPSLTNPFAQAFFAAEPGIAYDCLTLPLPRNFASQFCYGDKMARFDPRNRGAVDPRFRRDIYHLWPPQSACPADKAAILPLSSDISDIKRAIGALKPVSGFTHSAMGVLWGQRLLSPSWRQVWDDTVHPVDPASDGNAGARKAIVLLTDGEDTICGFDPSCSWNNLGYARGTACTAAKAAGTEIFVVAAMNPHLVSGELAAALRACSSQADNPEGEYVFINNSDAATLEAAFAEIANQLQVFRRVY